VRVRRLLAALEANNKLTATTIESVRNTSLRYFCIKRYFKDDYLRTLNIYSDEEFSITVAIYDAGGSNETPVSYYEAQVNANEFVFDTLLSAISLFAKLPDVSVPIESLGANFATHLFETIVMAYPQVMVLGHDGSAALDTTDVFKGKSESTVICNYGTWSELKKRQVINRTWKQLSLENPAISDSPAKMMHLIVTLPHEVRISNVHARLILTLQY
jgi:hypothetical protein